ncbi:MAG: hypothetical protein P0107_00605 [Nitrosomonas sp.]|nr:hypothetical protein [Nitrosomonas sp.]
MRLGQTLQQPAPLDIRVNSLLAKREEILAALEQQGIEAQPTLFLPSIRITGTGNQPEYVVPLRKN